MVLDLVGCNRVKTAGSRVQNAEAVFVPLEGQMYLETWHKKFQATQSFLQISWDIACHTHTHQKNRLIDLFWKVSGAVKS